MLSLTLDSAEAEAVLNALRQYIAANALADAHDAATRANINNATLVWTHLTRLMQREWMLT